MNTLTLPLSIIVHNKLYYLDSSDNRIDTMEFTTNSCFTMINRNLKFLFVQHFDQFWQILAVIL